tara:strand:+ start:707 stop:1372 length:666 start_codon:yes stop_codon:yes gene_type:complete
MGEFGWAYVGGGAVSSSGGPIGSIQFKTGTQSISGSQKLTFLTGSDSLYLTGTLFVSGTINANNYDVITTTRVEIDQSGNTNFGDTDLDTHAFTGSLTVTKESGLTIFSASNALEQVKTLGLAMGYTSSTSVIFTSSTSIVILGISASNAPEPLVRLHSAKVAGSGALMIIKDEISGRTGGIQVTASDGQTIDAQANYRMTGSAMTAINLYSNGHDGWFVF